MRPYKSFEYEVSILVCSYRPRINEMLFTLKSILLQREIKLQIIIADDGSECDLFQEIIEFFEKCKFQDYQLVANDFNRGTVYNLLNGLSCCKSEFVKALSPGDALYGDVVLNELIETARTTGADIILHDVVCYNMFNGFQIIKTYAHPQRPKVYSVHNIAATQRNYLLLDDIGFGSAFITRTELWKRYIEMLAGKVVYAEDHSWRLMVATGMTISYCPIPATLYEYGTGISTSGNIEWKKRLGEDWENADIIIYKLLETERKLQNKFLMIMNGKSKQRRMRYKIRIIRILSSPIPVIFHKIRCKLFPRYTPTTFKHEIINELFDYQEA